MEVDTSSRFKQPTAWFKQKINFTPEEKPDDDDFDSVAQACATEIRDELGKIPAPLHNTYGSR